MFAKAIALARAGDKAGARQLLHQIVTEDPGNEHAWGWLAACAATPSERQQALECVLEINPHNEAARRALEKLEMEELVSQQPRSPQEGPPPPEGAPRRFWSWSTTTRRRAAIVLSLIILLVCCCPVGVIGLLFTVVENEGGEVEAVPARTGAPVVAEEPGLATLAPTPTAWFPVPQLPATDTPLPTAALAPTTTPQPTDTPALSPTMVIAMVEAQVIEVVDGDTIKVLLDGAAYTVRYIGIDTPETVHPEIGVEWMGPEASAANEELVAGKTVRLERDVSETDRYGRLLRYVYVGDLFVNQELVRLGYAQVSTYPPDTKYVDLFTAAQREAREAGRGLWAPATPVPLECLGAAYVADVTVPDNTRFEPGESFVKTWRVQNTGACPWPPGTQLVVARDDAIVSPGSVQVGELQPGATAELSVEMAAPAADGRYSETWRLADGDRRFGGNLTVVITVRAAAPTATPVQPRPTPAPP
jgi:endonuclease YncB( thermonuclease family)